MLVIPSMKPCERLTVVVSAVPEQSAALADRFGRYLPADTEPVPAEGEECARGRAARQARAARARERARIAALDEERAGSDWGVTLGGVDLARAGLDDVRRQVLVSDTGSQLFAGTLQDAVDPHGRLTREQAEFVLRYYELHPITGQRLIRRGVFSRPRGHGKSPLTGALSCVEGMAPIVPAGWDANGKPVA